MRWAFALPFQFFLNEAKTKMDYRVSQNYFFFTTNFFSKCDQVCSFLFDITDFFSKYDQIRSFLWAWSYLLKKPLMENFIFCAVNDLSFVTFLTIISISYFVKLVGRLQWCIQKLVKQLRCNTLRKEFMAKIC